MTPEKRRAEMVEALAFLGWDKTVFARRYGMNRKSVYLWFGKNTTRQVPLSVLKFLKLCCAIKAADPDLAERAFALLDE